MGCQEDTCDRCGAHLRRAHRGPSSWHQLPRHGPERVRRAGAHRRGPVTQRVVADPAWADDFARRRREHAEGRAHAAEDARELATAIEAGDATYGRLSRRLDDFGARVDVVRARQADSPAHRALVSHR
jgi:hypothetical protein